MDVSDSNSARIRPRLVVTDFQLHPARTGGRNFGQIPLVIEVRICGMEGKGDSARALLEKPASQRSGCPPER